MAYTQTQLDAIANYALDFYMSKVWPQRVQNKPLMKALKARQKSFPGGKGNINLPVKGDYTSTISGYSYDDQVGFANPQNVKRVAYAWKELHEGISVAFTELKVDGITVTDSAMGKTTSEHSNAEQTRIAQIFTDKLDDMAEGWDIAFDAICHKDGTQDSKVFPGLALLVPDNPYSDTVGGLSNATYTWWRSRAMTATGDGSGGDNRIDVTGGKEIVATMIKEARQLSRFGGKITNYFCGSDFLDQLIVELRAKGYYTLQGWTAPKSTDISMADVSFNGINFEYDPTLDDESKAKYCYALDLRHLYLDVMDGEDMRKHSPARPHDQYILYRSVTWTGGLVCDQRNAQGVYVFK